MRESRVTPRILVLEPEKTSTAKTGQEARGPGMWVGGHEKFGFRHMKFENLLHI
jgi:hypothetical protein